MKRKILLTAAVLLPLASLLTVSTLAVFTDSDSVAANTFTSGNVELTTSPTTALVTYSNMAPGDEVVNPITVTNAGSLDLRYALLSTTTENTLAGALQLTVKTGVATCTTGGFAGSGTVVYNAGVLGTTTGTKVLGDAAQGAQAGDRALAAGANETLCVRVNLPLSTTGSAYEGVTTTATFTFDAEQTKNN